MNFNDLSKYVFQKYGLKFTPALPGSTELYVLKSPLDDSYFAMYSRIKKTDAGLASDGYLPVLDLKCDSMAKMIRDLPGFTSAFRLTSPDWVGVRLNRGNDQAIKNALDYAFKLALNGDKAPIINQQYIYIPGQNDEEKYHSQKIKPRSQTLTKRREKDIPPAIQKMRSIYDYSILPAKGRSKNFYHQGQLMKDYQDDYQNWAAFKRYYPTYHDMNVEELRTYFTWRGKIRAGKYVKISSSYAYVYIYELLNNIGVQSPQDGFDKLTAFLTNYAQKYDPVMTDYLERWRQDYVLYYQLDEDAIKTAFAKEIKQDHFYHILLKSEEFSEQDIFAVFNKLSPYLGKCLMMQKMPKQVPGILKQVWLQILAVKKEKGLSFFHKYIAHRNLLNKNLFAGAVFYDRNDLPAAKYQIDEERFYFYQHHHWYCNELIANKRQKNDLNTLMHEVDRLVREKYHFSRKLKPRKLEPEFLAAIQKGLALYEKQQEEAKRPKIQINFADLGQIRADASVTRDSLLTDEEIKIEQEEQKQKIEQEKAKEVKQPQVSDTYGLNQDELFFLLALLQHTSWQDYLKEHHLMASILADQINDKLFDEIGDSVIEFDEQDKPQIIEDYEPDLKEMFLKKE